MGGDSSDRTGLSPPLDEADPVGSISRSLRLSLMASEAGIMGRRSVRLSRVARLTVSSPVVLFPLLEEPGELVEKP